MQVNYGALRGKIIDYIIYKHGADHFQIEVSADQNYRIAVDVYSQFAGQQRHYSPDGDNTLDTDRMVMFYKDENFSHPITNEILNLQTGFTSKSSLNEVLQLDYLRTRPILFPIDDMKVVSPKGPGHKGDDLNDDIKPWVKKSLNNDDAQVFAFGSGWDDNAAGAHPDAHPYFTPNPSVGIHDIHMNQGDTGKEAKYNDTYQDGALFFYFKSTGRWVAMFFKFQVQSTRTDDNGNAL